MAKRLKKSVQKPAGSGAQADVLAKQVMDSAQKIWLAGLGAFAKAQEEGGKVFETLVEQGQALEQKTRAIAGQAVETAKAQATQSVGKASQSIDKLDQVFQARVHRSLNKLGVLTSKDIDELTRQVTELSESVRGLVASEKAPRTGSRKAAPRKKATAKPAAAKPVAKATAKAAGTVAKVTKAAGKTARTAVRKGVKKASQAVKTVTDKLV